MDYDELMHYGTPRHSGRYPWGSGDNPYQHERDFLSTVKSLQDEGLSEKEIADYFEMSVKQLRSTKSNYSNEVRAANVAQALRLKDKGYSNVAIGEAMGVNESTVRSWLDPAISHRTGIAKSTADSLEEAIADKKYVDVGGGVENQLGISRTALNNSIQILKDKGYNVYYISQEQMGTGKKTSVMVLAAPDVTYSEVLANKSDISYPGFFMDSDTESIRQIKDPVQLDSSRIQVRYAEEGGTDMDGVIQIRRGCEDLSLGNAMYAQVRIGVDGTHYLKGMAMYCDDMPDGVDVIFNTNKHEGTPMLGDKDNSVLKPIKQDQDNPFGATIRQFDYTDSEGNKHQSPINIVNEEGDWNTWRKSISSQMLSKQSPILAKQQLDLAYSLKRDELDEIESLTNPVVKKQLLEKFADGADSAAVHLKAAGLPRQASKVILPFPDMDETQCYCPTLRDGEKVVLIRYPHAGTFEIPELTVNNKNAKAKSLINNAEDAIGINPKVAQRLSGADFDGDTVLVIPCDNVKIKTSSALKGLADFDPSESYPAYEGMIRTGEKGSGFHKQRQMGDVSNLITDMTIGGATQEELARAVRHSMVVIDAEKHNLNWRQSYIDNGIAQLKEKYQGRSNAGASTLISKASSQLSVPVRKEITNPKKMTADELVKWNNGEKVYRETGETYTDKKGKTVTRLVKSTKMAETSDAYSLSSGSIVESVYAEYANNMKALANEARRVSRSTKDLAYSPEAKKKYSTEVASLNAKLNEALKNRPLERKAQLLAGAKVDAVKRANPDMDKDDIKKLKGRSLTEARLKVGASKTQIYISDREWEAIQNGAISTNKLKQIINNSDIDILKQKAMPRTAKQGLSNAKVASAKSMAARGYTLSEIADALNVSVSTIENALK